MRRKLAKSLLSTKLRGLSAMEACRSEIEALVLTEEGHHVDDPKATINALAAALPFPSLLVDRVLLASIKKMLFRMLSIRLSAQ
jgi:hypothetical protein